MNGTHRKRKIKHSCSGEMPEKKTKLVSSNVTSNELSVTRNAIERVAISDKDKPKRSLLVENKLQNVKKATCSKPRPVSGDIHCVRAKTEALKTGSSVSGALDDKSTIHRKPNKVSTNWKELVKSGKISYNKKIEAKQVEHVNQDISAAACEKKSEIWFDDVDEVLLDMPKPVIDGNSLVKSQSFDGLTKIIGMDCEMVGVGDNGKDSILARVSLVNHFGHCIYDTFVKPTEKVTDYRTQFSGVRPADLVHAEDFKTVQQKVADLLKGRILVGHALHNDLQVLFLSHPRKELRDTSVYKPFRDLVRGGRPSLKKLTSLLLGVEVQQGEHNSIEDAQAAMRLYTLHRKEWENSLKAKFHGKRKVTINKKSDDRKQKQKSYTSM